MYRRLATIPVLCALLLAAPAAAQCRYRAELVDAAAMVLEVAVACPPGIERFVAEPRLAAVIERFTSASLAVALREDGWNVGPGPVSVRYRLPLGRLAAQTGDARLALRVGGSVVAVASQWLIQPLPADTPIRLTVQTPPGTSFATGFRQAEDGWRIDGVPLRFAGFSVFGRFTEAAVELPGRGALGFGREAGQRSRIRLAVLDGPLAMGPAAAAAGLRAAALAVGRLFQGFPPEDMLAVIVPQAGREGARAGQVVPGGGISLMLELGGQARPTLFRDDWVAVHELIHAATPFVPDTGPWLMEGLATYLEALARLRAGWVTPERVFTDFLENMPRGLPALTRDGLRSADPRGVYWGGALFMLLADLDIRQSSGGRLGLEHCLVALARQGVDATTRMTTAEFAGRCDGLTGHPVLARLLERHLDRGRPFDLDGLWARLGVEATPAGARLRPEAPLALLREVTLWGSLERPPPIPFP
ncbi:MAG: hypothetical protein OHK0024_23720 [Thalassobaculales bacterium]